MFGIKKDNKKSVADKDMIVNQIRKFLDEDEIHYGYDSSDKIFRAVFKGDDLPIRTLMKVTDVSVQFVCLLDLQADSKKFQDVCWRLNDINRKLSFGAFYLDPDDGFVSFEYGLIYADSNISSSTLRSTLGLVLETADQHDGELKKIAEPSERSNLNPMFG